MSYKFPATSATRFLKQHSAEFTLHPYTYVESGGTQAAAKALKTDEHMIIKTLVMETSQSDPLIILMHGDRQVSTRKLARAIGTTSIKPCHPGIARKHTGYVVGGTSPFGTRKSLPVYVEKSILELNVIFINAGKRGLLARLSPLILPELLQVIPVEVTQ